MHTSNQCSWRERGVFIEYAIDLIYLPFRIPGAKGWKPWQHSSISSGVAWHLSNAFSSCLFKYRKGGNQKEIKRAMEEKTGCGLTHFSSGWVQFWLCIRMAHTHTHTHPSPTHTFTYTHQTNSKHANRHFSQKTHTHTRIQIIHLFRKGWLRLQKYSCTGPAHAPLNTSEWVIGCANGQCSHLFNRLWTMFHRGGCTTLHSDLTPIRFHYSHFPNKSHVMVPQLRLANNAAV